MTPDEVGLKPWVDSVSDSKAGTEATEEDGMVYGAKAALRSKDTRRVDLPVSEDWKMLLVVEKRAVSVEKYICIYFLDMRTDID